MGLIWSPWIVLDAEHVQQLGPTSPGLYEVKLDQRVVDYPGGKSAMIFYGCTDEEAPTLREALERDWLVPQMQEILQAWHEYGDVVFRFAVIKRDVREEYRRRLEKFVERFGRTPWANPEETAPEG